MKMKKLITILLALAMVLSLAACGSKDTHAPDGQNTPAATYKIKLGTTGNEEHQSTIAANFFKEKVEELTNGAVTVEIYPNSQLGSEREMAEGVKLGTLEMTIVTTDGTLPAWVPETQVLSIPYLLTSKEVAYEVLDNTLQPYFAPLFEPQGYLGSLCQRCQEHRSDPDHRCARVALLLGHHRRSDPADRQRHAPG